MQSPYLQSEIKKCINYGNVTSDNVSGGIIGSLPKMDSPIFTEECILIKQCYNAGLKIVANGNDISEGNYFYIKRICGYSGDDKSRFSDNYSINTTTLNGSIPTEDIGPDQKNGGSMTKAEIENAIQELGFELPGEFPNAS